MKKVVPCLGTMLAAIRWFCRDAWLLLLPEAAAAAAAADAAAAAAELLELCGLLQESIIRAEFLTLEQWA